MTEEQLHKLKQAFSGTIEFDVPFATLTTVSIGGPAKALLRIKDGLQLQKVLTFVNNEKIPFFILGGGSNLLVSDKGLDSVVIKLENSGITTDGTILTVQAGTSLAELVEYTISNGLSGVHKMIGIPGTVGGAIYGNAGAYGQTISDNLTHVRCLYGDKEVLLTKEDCVFEYRNSGFKSNNLVIIEANFAYPSADSAQLRTESQDCMNLRLKKYPPDVKCPGSFFRNLFTAEVSKSALAMLPSREDTYGKTPAYIFIEELGMKGKQIGQVKIHDNHGNLFMNLGGGTAQDFWTLAKECFDKTKSKYGVELHPEVQLINLPPLE
jgi:UDP-N-acetylmuramate dehydrogenase